MARVTVEDCIKRIPSRFELVAIATQRARAISSGAPLSISRDDDKDPVIALREIAKGYADIDRLRENVIDSFRINARTDKFGVEKVSEVVSGSGGEILEEAYEAETAISSEDAIEDAGDEINEETENLSALYSGEDVINED